MHNKKERAQSTMGLVESNTALFTNPMESKDTLDEYYRVFKAQVDTIKAHSGNPGYHGAVYCEHCKALAISKGYNTKEMLDAVGNAEIKKMKTEALKLSTGAYLGCISLSNYGQRTIQSGKNPCTKPFLRRNNNTCATCWP